MSVNTDPICPKCRRYLSTSGVDILGRHICQYDSDLNFIGSGSANEEELSSFTKYCKKNPEKQFFTALKDWMAIRKEDLING